MRYLASLLCLKHSVRFNIFAACAPFSCLATLVFEGSLFDEEQDLWESSTKTFECAI